MDRNAFSRKNQEKFKEKFSAKPTIALQSSEQAKKNEKLHRMMAICFRTFSSYDSNYLPRSCASHNGDERGI
jgi:hypothetical protein